MMRNNSKLAVNLSSEQNQDLNRIAEHLGISKSILVRLLLAKSITELKIMGIDNLEFKLEQIVSKNK